MVRDRRTDAPRWRAHAGRTQQFAADLQSMLTQAQATTGGTTTPTAAPGTTVPGTTTQTAAPPADTTTQSAAEQTAAQQPGAAPLPYDVASSLRSYVVQ